MASEHAAIATTAVATAMKTKGRWVPRSELTRPARSPLPRTLPDSHGAEGRTERSELHERSELRRRRLLPPEVAAEQAYMSGHTGPLFEDVVKPNSFPNRRATSSLCEKLRQRVLAKLGEPVDLDAVVSGGSTLRVPRRPTRRRMTLGEGRYMETVPSCSWSTREPQPRTPSTQHVARTLS
jgi:hypothetical protein